VWSRATLTGGQCISTEDTRGVPHSSAGSPTKLVRSIGRVLQLGKHVIRTNLVPTNDTRRQAPEICTTMTHIEQVGVRALQQHASAVLRRVVAGEQLEITDRGRPLALLVPLPKGDALERLEVARRLRRATRSDLPDPVPNTSGEKPLSDVLARQREDER
jgi:prevent-host-death family protein